MALESWYHLDALEGREQETEAIAAECLAAGEPLFASYARVYRARLMVDAGNRNEAAIYLGRFMADITDWDLGQVSVGQPVRMVFRVRGRDAQRGMVRYFWKAAPLAGTGEH